jgi:hypothetical protein
MLPVSSTSTLLRVRLARDLRLRCYPELLKNRYAKVAELADALDLGSSPARGRGSTPLFRTNYLAEYVPAWLSLSLTQPEPNTLRSLH